ncbi:uncharacterized protein LOC142004012 [Carettochelys insculpta]|uniref:uncharacterized protein LOC142004012 n=1 Tax=Carettochelys insculpta TaxID=44489 RepID=UPI003EBF60EC
MAACLERQLKASQHPWRREARWAKRQWQSAASTGEFAAGQILARPPPPRQRQVPGTANLACVIHGASSLVHVSWNVSGELQEEGLTRSLKSKDGSLMYINHISVPWDTWTSGKIFTCDVKFNSSGRSVQKSTRYLAAPAQQCSHYILPFAAAAGLLLLVVSLSLVWTLCHSTLGFQPRISVPPASQEHQGGMVYAHLDFDSQSRNRHTMQRSTREKHVKT